MFGEVITVKNIVEEIESIKGACTEWIHPHGFVFHRNHPQMLVISGIQSHSGELRSTWAAMMDSLYPLSGNDLSML